MRIFRCGKCKQDKRAAISQGLPGHLNSSVTVHSRTVHMFIFQQESTTLNAQTYLRSLFVKHVRLKKNVEVLSGFVNNIPKVSPLGVSEAANSHPVEQKQFSQAAAEATAGPSPPGTSSVGHVSGHVHLMRSPY